MGGMADVSRSEFAAATARAVDDKGQLGANALRAELLIETNRQLGAVHAKRLVDNLVGMGLNDNELEAVVGELRQRLDPADLTYVDQALDDANVNEGWFERTGERIGSGAAAVGGSIRDGIQWADRQASGAMADAKRYLDGVIADPDSSVLARGAAASGVDAVQKAQAGYGFAKGATGEALSTLGGIVDLGKMAWQMSTNADYRNVVVGMAKAYAAQVAADPSKPINDVAAAGKKALADWEAGLAKAKAEGREAEYLGSTAGAVALEAAATLIPASKLSNLGNVAKLLDKVTPEGMAALGRELGDLSRMALDKAGDAAAGAMQALKGIVGLARGKGELQTLVNAARASGNMDGLLKSGAFTPSELSHLQKASPEVFGGKVGFNDALAASTKRVDVSKLSKAEVGAIGEALVTRELVKRGYTDIVAIQNKSNHGIDIVARNKAGDLEFFEVKASGKGDAKAPEAGSANFIQSRLQRAIDAEGHWIDKNVPAGMRDLAQDIADEIRGTNPTAHWVQVNLAADKVTGLLDINATNPNFLPWPR